MKIFILYVDDGASLFYTRREAILGTEICFEQMKKRLGINMHTGDGNLLKLKLVSSYLEQKFNNG